MQGEPAGLPTRDAIVAARERWTTVRVDDAVLEALCAACVALGIGSARAPWYALQAARISAALAGRDSVEHDDAELAARLVLAPRARQLPAPPPHAGQDDPPPPPPSEPKERQEEEEMAVPDQPLDEQVLAAAAAAIPAGPARTPEDGTACGRRCPLDGPQWRHASGLAPGLPGRHARRQHPSAARA